MSEAIPPAPAAGAVAPIGIAVREIKVIEDNGQRGVFAKLSRPPGTLNHFALENPPRVVIDIVGAAGTVTDAQRFPVTDALVEQIRLAQHEGNLRLTIELRGKSVPAYTVNDLNDTVIAFLGEPQGNAEPVREQVVFSQRAAEVAAASVNEPHTVPKPASKPPAMRVADAEAPSGSSDPLERLTQPRSYTGPHVSLDLKDADVHNVIRLLAEVSKLNIVATEDVKGKVTLRLFDVPWDQALDIVLSVLSLESVQEGNVMRISTVNRLRTDREDLRRAQEALRAVEPLRVEYIHINYAKAVKLGDIVGGTNRSGNARSVESGTGILTNRGSVVVDEFTNTLIVRDVQRGIDNARELVRQLDVQTPQILIESSIVEATSDFARSLGVQWGYKASIGPQTGTTTGANFPGTIVAGGGGPGGAALGIPLVADFPAGGNFGPGSAGSLGLLLGSLNGAYAIDARITALEDLGKAKIVSRPRVVTLNNVPATIKSLTIIRVKLPGTGTVINTGAGGAAGGQSTATEKIETGITLVVTPQVSSDGFVLLDMFAKSSQADFTRTVDQIPTEISREANSHVLIKDGQTVVLGGIYRDQRNDAGRSMPFLADIPGLGWLFRNTTKTDRREDLLVFLTPRVLGGAHPGLPSSEDLWQHRGEAGVQ
ncbi:MAG: type IV pilus secretin PilQ [Deltaproteobacteria bacterium]|nr:type IV pilus secretin PilQ [Deltaproteobacteria bacterium]MBI3389811.1 type IV pilus secretin PilQ [Deltaproteobacteria bacterium]